MAAQTLAAAGVPLPRNRAAFTLSLDFELAWGTRDRNRDSFYRPICRREREVAITRLGG